MLRPLSVDEFTRPNLLPERIAEHLRGRIAGGHIKPGQRLTEQALTQEYAVSRVPLREALRILSTEGLITLAAHRGATVVGLSETELRELFGVRSAVEEFAARALAENPSARVVAALGQLNRQMKSDVSGRDFEAYERNAVRFHETLVNGSGNGLLISYYGQVERRFRCYQAALAHVPRSATASIREHTTVLKAITQGDPDAAAEATRSHIRNLISRFLGASGPFSAEAASKKST